MHRFFVPIKLRGEVGERFMLEGTDAYHMINVLRKKTSDAVTVCDKDGSAFLCVIEALFPSRQGEPPRAELAVRGKADEVGSGTASQRRKVLFQAFAKSDKMDLIVQKATELGVTEIVPVYMKRCVSVPDARGATHKNERWTRIAYEASKQCKRNTVPSVLPPVSFSDALKSMKENDIYFCCHEDAKYPLRSFLGSSPSFNTEDSSIAFLIGPEGGYDPEETEELNSLGIPLVSLGSLILRTETAPLAVLSMLLYEDMPRFCAADGIY